MKKFDENIKKQYFNTYTFSNYNINKSILLLQKIICPYKHMNDWKKFIENSLPEKEDFILKNSNLKLDLLTDIEMLLMVEKGMEGGICQAVHQYAKANKKNIKDYEENKEWSYCEY